MEQIFAKAIKVATSPFTHAFTPTMSCLKNICATQDGPVEVKKDLIVVPVDVLLFSCLKSYKVKVIIYRDTFKVKQILR